MQRRDDKLADFWQRARDRAWAVGNCPKGSEFKAVRAVQQAECAQTLLQQRPSSLLHQAEADVALQACELLLAESTVRSYRSKSDFLDRLYSATGSVHHLLSGYNLICARSCQFSFAGADTVVTPAGTDEVLLWAAKIVRTIHSLSKQRSQDNDGEDGSSQAERIVFCLDALCWLLYKPGRLGDVTQLMFVADISIWSLQLHDAGDLLGSWALDAVANAYPTSSLAGEPPSSALRAFRVQLTATLETALLSACPALQQELSVRWPQQRRVWRSAVTEVVPSASQEATDAILQTALQGLRWQQTRRGETDSDLQRIAEQISARAAEVARFQQDLVEAPLATEPTAKPGVRSNASDVTAWLLRATKLVMLALELQFEAGKSGQASISTQCTQVCNLLLPITSRGELLFSSKDESRREPLHHQSVQGAVDAICKRCEMHISAIAAELRGRSDIAGLWLTAAKVCARAVSSDEEDELDDRLRSGWRVDLQRAEALAEQVRRAEEDERAGAGTIVSVVV
jgi:hypothetical protein